MTAGRAEPVPILTATLARVGRLLSEATRPWWIIGSAAVALHGAAAVVTRDVDVLVDPADMSWLGERTGLVPRPGIADDWFRSAQVLALADAPLPIDMFAGLKVRDGDVWRIVCPTTREPIAVGDAIVFVPTAAELIDILLQFGRTKDLLRADLLRATLN